MNQHLDMKGMKSKTFIYIYEYVLSRRFIDTLRGKAEDCCLSEAASVVFWWCHLFMYCCSIITSTLYMKQLFGLYDHHCTDTDIQLIRVLICKSWCKLKGLWVQPSSWHHRAGSAPSDLESNYHSQVTFIIFTLIFRSKSLEHFKPTGSSVLIRVWVCTTSSFMQISQLFKQVTLWDKSAVTDVCGRKTRGDLWAGTEGLGESLERKVNTHISCWRRETGYKHMRMWW